MIKNKYINEAHKNEILFGLYKEEPLALQLYSWWWLQQQSCEDHEAYVQRLDRYAKILYKDKALVKIKLIDNGFGTKKKKGLVLTGTLSWPDGSNYRGALKSEKEKIPHGEGVYFFT